MRSSIAVQRNLVRSAVPIVARSMPFRVAPAVAPASTFLRHLSSASLYHAPNPRTTPATPLTALASSIPRHAFSTDTSSRSPPPPGGDPSFPPPGFNADQAKKPLPTATQQGSQTKPAPADQTTGSDTPRADAQKKNEPSSESKASLTTPSASLESNVAQKEETKEKPKLTVMQKVKKEVQHYWDGTKLLATEMRISTKLAVKMTAGYELSRRESRQLRRTVQDLSRLVPFSMFILIPFAELLLPVALKLFPNLLPSTYEGKSSRDQKAAILRGTRNEVSSFIRNTLKESGLPVSSITARKEEFAAFFHKIRATGETPTAEEVIKVSKNFKDDLTLDNLSRPQLVAICKYMNLRALGPDTMIRYIIRNRMRQIKRDDRAIYLEGVDTLSTPELQLACAARGLRTHHISASHLRDDLSMWLDLRLVHGIPSTLLVLSNAYTYNQRRADSEIETQIDALGSVLSSIPEELFHEIELEVHNAEGAATNKQRLDVIKEQESLIAEESKQQQDDNTHIPVDEDIGEEDVKETAQEGEKGKVEEKAPSTKKND